MLKPNLIMKKNKDNISYKDLPDLFCTVNIKNKIKVYKLLMIVLKELKIKYKNNWKPQQRNSLTLMQL